MTPPSDRALLLVIEAIRTLTRENHQIWPGTTADAAVKRLDEAEQLLEQGDHP